MALRKGHVIIGANFGDEGKGLLTDYLVSQLQGSEALVVRFNGGANAGHTVVTPEGKRHVFRHFSAGTFQNARTYLSRHVVCNPVLFLQELETLMDSGVRLKIFAHPECLITTPFDMAINQMIETSRGASRHGSTGMGLNETIHRSQHPRHAIRLEHLDEPDALMFRLIAIREEYIPRRVSELGLHIDADLSKLNELDSLEKFAKECRIFNSMVEPADDRIIRKFEPVIFEGSAGLLLDQSHHWRPHVTRSSTGLRNALEVASKASLGNLDAFYVTRGYMTRHGAGPFPTEMPLNEMYPDIEDATNVENPYQGPLRFGLLTLDLLRSSVHTDLRQAKDVKVAPSIVVTCLDQLDRKVRFHRDGVSKQTGVDEFLDQVGKHTGINVAFTSHGPRRTDVRKI